MPKPYLSWSQLNLWESSPKTYYDRYVLNKKQYTSPAMRLGTRIHEQLCKREDTDLQKVYDQIPMFDEYEKKIIVQPEGLDINLLGFMDGQIDDLIIEVKTSIHPYTQAKVDKMGQIEFYSLMTGLSKARLYWIEIKHSQATGRVEQFDRVVTDSHRSDMYERIQRTLQGIKDYKPKKRLRI